MSFQEGLGGDRGRDKVLWCRLLTLFQEGPHQIFFFQEIFFVMSSTFINTLDATRHLSGTKKKATKILFAPAIVDGLYCRLNFTVRLAIPDIRPHWVNGSKDAIIEPHHA